MSGEDPSHFPPPETTPVKSTTQQEALLSTKLILPTTKPKIIFLTGTPNETVHTPPFTLADEIVRLFSTQDEQKIPLRRPIGRFADGELRSVIPDSRDIEGKDVFILLSTAPPDIDGSIMQICFIADAAKRNGAERVTAVIPYYGYARQDRDAPPGSAASSSVVAKLICTAGVDRIFTLDIHSQQQRVVDKLIWQDIDPAPLFVPFIQQLDDFDPSQARFLFPDASSYKRTRHLAELLGVPEENMITVIKTRKDDIPDTVHSRGEYENVQGKDVIVVDDIVGTGGTIFEAGLSARKHGARRIHLIATHGVLRDNRSPHAIPQHLDIFDTMTFSNSIPHRTEVTENEKIHIVNAAFPIAQEIHRIHSARYT